MRTFSTVLMAIFVIGSAPVVAQTVEAAPVVGFTLEAPPGPVPVTPRSPSAAPVAEIESSAITPKQAVEGSKNTGPTAEEIALLREEYTALRRREAAVLSDSQPASPKLSAELAAVRDQIGALESAHPLATWKRDTLIYFLEQMRKAPLNLPPDVPPGLEIDPAVVQLKGNTGLYSAPELSEETVLETSAGPTPVLRIANHGPMMMIWTPGVGFAYVVSRFVEVFE